MAHKGSSNKMKQKSMAKKSGNNNKNSSSKNNSSNMHYTTTPPKLSLHYTELTAPPTFPLSPRVHSFNSLLSLSLFQSEGKSQQEREKEREEREGERERREEREERRIRKAERPKPPKIKVCRNQKRPLPQQLDFFVMRMRKKWPEIFPNKSSIQSPVQLNQLWPSFLMSLPRPCMFCFTCGRRLSFFFHRLRCVQRNVGTMFVVRNLQDIQS